MHFCFYPDHQYGCPHVGHCPHLGGAALGTLVSAAHRQTDWMDALHRQIDSLRAENTAKYHKIEEQAARIEQLDRELKAERQKQFKAQKQNHANQNRRKERPSPERRNAGRPWAIRAGTASVPRTSTGWFSFPRHANAHTATGQ